jgi:hypothetical protein
LPQIINHAKYPYCVIGYENENYNETETGKAWYFHCGEKELPDWNDRFTSMRIAPDKKLKVCHHSGKDQGGVPQECSIVKGDIPSLLGDCLGKCTA